MNNPLDDLIEKIKGACISMPTGDGDEFNDYDYIDKDILLDDLEKLRPYFELADFIKKYVHLDREKYHNGLGFRMSEKLEQDIAEMLLNIEKLEIAKIVKETNKENDLSNLLKGNKMENVIKNLKDAIDNYYDKLSAGADNIIDDTRAIRYLTQIENQQIADEKIIEDFENLCQKMNISIG